MHLSALCTWRTVAGVVPAECLDTWETKPGAASQSALHSIRPASSQRPHAPVAQPHHVDPHVVHDPRQRLERRLQLRQVVLGPQVGGGVVVGEVPLLLLAALQRAVPEVGAARDTRGTLNGTLGYLAALIGASGYFAVLRGNEGYLRALRGILTGVWGCLGVLRGAQGHLGVVRGT
jgi:hypothetical protein